jgi:hypothetical protein
MASRGMLRGAEVLGFYETLKKIFSDRKLVTVTN